MLEALTRFPITTTIRHFSAQSSDYPLIRPFSRKSNIYFPPYAISFLHPVSCSAHSFLPLLFPHSTHPLPLPFSFIPHSDIYYPLIACWRPSLSFSSGSTPPFDTPMPCLVPTTGLAPFPALLLVSNTSLKGTKEKRDGDV